jgi:hypothetical protein
MEMVKILVMALPFHLHQSQVTVEVPLLVEVVPWTIDVVRIVFR